MPRRVGAVLVCVVAALSTPGCEFTTDRVCSAAQAALDELSRSVRAGSLQTDSPEWAAALGHLRRMSMEAKGSGNRALDLRAAESTKRFLAADRAADAGARSLEFAAGYRAFNSVAEHCRLAGLPLRPPGTREKRPDQG